MPLETGTRLGPYEIVSPLGAGGMGEVYRARDTRLDRTVAIKVLPAEAASSPERRERFEREARAVSSLNHPNICTLYDVGRHGDVDYLVMEHLEGETLAQRLTRGALGPQELLARAVEIADALDRAHRQGVIHRDLKPANIMITRGGAKLLDFGLARSHGPAGAAPGLSALVTERRSLTGEGTILGTLQYMSPEQLEGKEADGRADLFAFGAVLHEMATGRRAFEGTSQASLIAAIMSQAPAAVTNLQPLAPPALDRVIQRCLAKDPDDRWQSARDVALELRWIASHAAMPAPAAAVGAASRAPLWTAIIVVAALLAGLAAGALWNRPAPATSASRVQLSLIPPRGGTFEEMLALSPDGSRLVFEARVDAVRALWLREMGSLEPRRLAGTEGAKAPFWSPDSRKIGFFADGKLKKLDLGNGGVQVICEARDGRGGAWAPDDTIVMAPFFTGPLHKVPASGGEPVPLTTVDTTRMETSHRWPVFLPDGRHFLFLARGRRREAEWIHAGSLDGGATRPILHESSSMAWADGDLFFVREGALMALPFDPVKLEPAGDPITLAEQVEQYGEFGPTRYAAFGVSGGGTVVYRTSSSSLSRMTWFNRDGRTLEAVGPPGTYSEPAISPDGRTLMVSRVEPQAGSEDLWSVDLGRGILTRFTHHEDADVTPVWSPDGKRIAFASNRKSVMDLYVKDLSGGEEELLISSDHMKWPDDWSSDGAWLIYEDNAPDTSTDLWVMPMRGERTPRAWLATPFSEMHARFSPDGRWVAYTSDESGQREVYAQGFPGPGPKVQISTAGGGQPMWGPGGRELLYMTTDGTLMSVLLPDGPGRPALPAELFRSNPHQTIRSDSRNEYLLSPDGQRILVVTVEKMDESLTTVILNWKQGSVVR
jgi:Tol biopolymer transport system component